MIGVLDFETSDFSTAGHIELKFGYLCFYDNNKIARFRVENAGQVFNIIMKIRKKYKKSFKIYCHNLDYDFKFLYKYMVQNFYFKIIDNGGLIFSISVYKSSDTNGSRAKICEFRNSLRLLPASLKKIGEAIKLRKLEMDPNNIEAFNKYCKRDCDIVYKALVKFVEFFSKTIPISMEKLPLSISSLAYKVFHEKNKRYAKEIEYIDKTTDRKKKKKINILTDINSSINDEFRQFYYGGRVEVFDMNTMDVMYCDFNSLYPDIMINNEFPIPPYKKVTIASMFQLTDKMFALKCIVDERNERYPIVPSKIDNKLVFSASVKECILTREEYLYIKEKRPKTEISVVEAYICSKFDNIFEYMRSFYNDRVEIKKKNESNCFEFFIKIFLNSSYGKFGEKKEKKEMRFYSLSELDRETIVKIIDEHPDSKIDTELNYIYVNQKEEKHVRNNLVFASRITALARLKLTKLIDFCVRNDIRFVYCDTDSLFIEDTKRNIELLNDMLDEFELGKLKIEDTFTQFTAFGNKEYLYSKNMKQFSKCKGLPRNSNFTDYIKNGVRVVRPIKYKESLVRKIDIENSIEIIKKKGTFYDKRIILNDYTTLPISSSLADNRHVFEDYFMKNYNIDISAKPKIYERKIEFGRYGPRIYCPICKETYYLDEFIHIHAKSYEDFEMSDVVTTINKLACRHLVRFSENIISSNTKAVFVKEVENT